MTLRRRLEQFASSGREADRITASLFDAIVVALRRDQRLIGIKTDEFDLPLADVRNEAERRLFNELVDRVHLDDVDVVDGEYP